MERECARSSVAQRTRDALALLGGFALVFASLVATGCQPGVGSACTLSTDCGTTGALVCDTSEFQGYCTVEDCVPNECPNNAACVLFNPEVPGCAPNDRVQGSRIGQQFCMATCGSNSNCRDGYECKSPLSAPWHAAILDTNQFELVCIPIPLEGADGGNSGYLYDPEAAVCQAVGPVFDADFPPLDASDVMTLDSQAADSEARESEVGEAGESGADATHSGD